MDLPNATRAAVIARLSAAVQLDPALPVPRDWSQLTVTQRLIVDQLDPQLGQVLRGVGAMSADVELAVMNGTFADKAPAIVTPEQQRAQAVADWCEAHPVVDPVEATQRMNQQVAERQASGEMARREAIEIASRQMKHQAAASRGW